MRDATRRLGMADGAGRAHLASRPEPGFMLAWSGWRPTPWPN